MIEVVELAARTQTVEALTDRLVRERGYPQPIEKFITLKVIIQITKDKLSFPTGIRGHDNPFAPGEKPAQHLQLAERRRVGLVTVLGLDGPHDQLESGGDDRQHVPLDAAVSILVGERQREQVSQRSCHGVAVSAVVSVLFFCCAHDAGDRPRHAGLLANNTNHNT